MVDSDYFIDHSSSLVQNPLVLRNRLAPKQPIPPPSHHFASQLASPSVSEFHFITFINNLLAGLFSLLLSLSQKPASIDEEPDTVTQEDDSGETLNHAVQNQILKDEDNDCSLIILDSNPFESEIAPPDNEIPSKSIFDTMYGDEKEEFTLPSDQYGTSLAISENSSYAQSYSNPSRNWLVSLNYYDDVDSQVPQDPNLTVNLDFLNQTSKPKSEYDATISNWYLPSKPIPKDLSLIDTIIGTLSVTNFFKNERDKIINKISKERQLSASKISDLNSEQLNVVKKYWSSNAVNNTIVSQYSIDISVRDLQTLYYGRWLNDNVMDFYFNLITDKTDSCFGWTTHFFTTLQQRGYQGVARWSKRKKVNVNTTNLILIPINIMSTHWALAVVDNEYKTITYYDSLSSNGNLSALLLIKDYMIQEGKKNNSPIDYEEFEIQPNFKTPQQQNGSDCGVFTCICAKYIATSKPLTYSQNDMKIFRRRMSYEIINKNLLD